MSEQRNFNSVDEYISNYPLEVSKALKELKNCILKAAPDAVESFNYNIPAFSLVKNGKRDQQIMIAGYKKHVGFYPHPSVIEKFADELKGYKKGKGSVQFQILEPIPSELIIRMVKYRKEMIEKNR